MLIDMEEQQICWSPSNLTRVLGYDLRNLRNISFKSIFVEPNLVPVVKDGLLLNQQAVCQDGTSILVDMCFQVGEAESHEVIASFHKVSERADFKSKLAENNCTIVKDDNPIFNMRFDGLSENAIFYISSQPYEVFNTV